ncbi:DNA helicase-2/ATP-dependent DNA helicase PcrA [Natranaerovirga pectinivora]|uniref:DNA 3'-5' helicase n=1 Tax=Natranaerovirga pectinivora TaxID=682400 RepID=A0A4R3MUY4_9FIRM|nr:RNA polymerase recycling motor HelD [Natranaerovirga pectinivora]TCT17116.1 DNA helicase-2/ATP-dependent DNA helicase PcrA [Natranaerovirga pectinivora]
MSKNKEEAYQEERERLEYTIDYLIQNINATEDYKNNFKSNIKEAYENLDPQDSSQSYINIIINSNLLETAIKNYTSYKKAVKKPYFARIDIKSEASDELEKLYIGKTSLFKEDNSPVILDWRSPLASVYYDGRLGEVTYDSPGGEEIVDLVLKRQFTIAEGELENFVDIDITANDAFLQAALEENADDRLKDIASTIQAEQNKVIRAELKNPLIVQGVAGSGKTTIALHRIAYFIYTYENIFDPDNFMIIAPNKLFINYISEVLPELGVEDVNQTTFTELMEDFIGFKFKVKNPFEDMETLIQNKTNENVDLLKWLLSFKGSLKVKDIIDDYISTIKETFVPDEDFALQENIIVKKENIKRMFLVDLEGIPLYKRVEEIKKNLKYRFGLVKKQILRETENEFDRKIQHIRNKEFESEERRLKLVELINARDEKLETLRKDSTSLVRKYITKFPKTKLMDYYKDLFTNKETLMSYVGNDLSKEQIEYLSNYVKSAISKKTFDLEDLSTIAYMRHKIFGLDKKYSIKNVVIDEAQDYSPLQIYALKQIFNTNMFTLLGDLSQGIYSYRAINTWDEVMNNIFDNKTDYMTLVQSYRTTIEIMELANDVIKKLDNQLDLAKPVIRHGKKPEIESFDNENEVIEAIYQSIEEIKDNYTSIAVICKSAEECMYLKKELSKKGLTELQVIDESQENYGAGIILVPSYLAKGLEFDAVILAAIKERFTMNALDLKLLYVALTRSLHRLFIYSIRGNIEALNQTTP